MRLALFDVPYDSGRFGERMGRGPLRLIERGLPGDLERSGHDVRQVPIRLDDLAGGFTTEVGSAFEIHRRLAGEVAAARAEGRFPLVLAGNCNATIGAVAGLGLSPGGPTGPTGIVWLDAHGDFNTPDTSISGFLDGMALSFLAGLSWRAAARRLPGFAPVSPRDVVLVGARDLDPDEERLLESSGVVRVRVEEIRTQGVAAALGPVFEDLARRVSRIHLHIDLDVLDPSEGRANVFAVPGGLTVGEIAGLIGLVGEAARRLEIAGATLSAYDPDEDSEDRIPRAAAVIALAVASGVMGGVP
jgi:arginase